MNADRNNQVAELAETYGQMVFATAYRSLGNGEDAEDALQEVFLKMLSAWNGRLKTGGVRNWGAYLRTVASRCAVDLLRRRTKRKPESDELSDLIEAPPGQDPRSLASQRQRARLLRQALAALPTRDARVFALRYFEDFSYEEIAAQMGLDVNHVSVILFRGRKRLEELLRPLMAPDEAGTTGTRNIAPALGKENNHVSA